jgi:hypothetical protein
LARDRSTFAAIELDTQQLLYGSTPRLANTRGHETQLPATLDGEGFCVVDRVASLRHACDVLDGAFPAYTARIHRDIGIARSLQLAKADRIPVCAPVVASAFQALHFDMGLPLDTPPDQVGYLFTALWRPNDAIGRSATTRVLPLCRLRNQRTWGDFESVESRLVAYVRAVGDGWRTPDAHNTKRLSCFARVIDALRQRRDLASYRDLSTAEWFRNAGAPSLDGSVETKSEAAYFASAGYELRSLEEAVTLMPGQLLIIDNVRCVHGRLGMRQPREIVQLMYGVSRLTGDDVVTLRRALTSYFAD